MKAVLVHRPGGPEVLELVDQPIPEPGPNQVQIRIEAMGVGIPDVLIRTGVYKWMPPLPANPGFDAAGRISAIGPAVSGLEIGRKVLLSSRELAVRGGCYAEYAVAPAEALFPLAESIDPQEAVCLGNYQLGWTLLHDCRHPRSANSVLIAGAAGGVGTALVQLARMAGMQVIGTVSSEEKAEFARSNGADAVIFYRREDVVARTLDLTGGNGVGLVLDHVSGPGFVSYLGALGNWGTLVSYNMFSPLPEQNLIERMRRHIDVSPAVRCFSFHSYDHDRAGRRALMREAISALERRAIKPPIFARFPLAEVRRAHELLESGQVLGKIVLTP